MDKLEANLNRFTAAVSKGWKDSGRKVAMNPRYGIGVVRDSRTTCPECREVWESPLGGWHICPECQGERCLANFARICPTEYAATDEARLPSEQWRTVSQWNPGDVGLLLVGPTGTGKTRAAWMLIKRLCRAGLKVTAFSPAGFNTELVDAQMKSEGKAFLDRVCKAPLVFFDDLGKGKMTDNVEMALFEVIEQRTAWRLPTIATTNDNGETLAGRMTANRAQPFVRRLRSYFKSVIFQKDEGTRV